MIVVGAVGIGSQKDTRRNSFNLGHRALAEGRKEGRKEHTVDNMAV